MVTKQQLFKLKGWYYPYITTHEIMKMSGWKFYIFGETIDDSYTVGELLTPVAEKYNVTMKIATQSIISRNTGKGIAWSIAVIYLNTEVFEDEKVGKLVEDINVSLRNYSKTGKVMGARAVNGKLHYRYDLKQSVDAKRGVVYETYLKLYRGETGDYNIPDNQDIISLLNVE